MSASAEPSPFARAADERAKSPEEMNRLELAEHEVATLRRMLERAEARLRALLH